MKKIPPKWFRHASTDIQQRYPLLGSFLLIENRGGQRINVVLKKIFLTLFTNSYTWTDKGFEVAKIVTYSLIKVYSRHFILFRFLLSSKNVNAFVETLFHMSFLSDVARVGRTNTHLLQLTRQQQHFPSLIYIWIYIQRNFC